MMSIISNYFKVVVLPSKQVNDRSGNPKLNYYYCDNVIAADDVAGVREVRTSQFCQT